MPPPSSKSAAKADDAERYQRTLARLSRIQNHLKTTPRAGRLSGKVCIVTGAGSLRGIGRATALLFAHQGARHLYLLDFQGDNLPELKKTIEDAYPEVKATTVQGDAADEATISALCERALKEQGRLDVFFANAGIANGDHMYNISDEQYMRTLRVNSLSCFLAVKYAGQAMQKVDAKSGKEESGGSIIMTASVAGMASGAGSMDYSASKATVISLAKTASFQLARTNVRVNSIAPGLINTSMNEVVFKMAQERGTESKLGQLAPLQRYGIPEEIAQVVLFLASDEASFVNGSNVAIDGGMTASMPIVPGKFF